MKQARFEAEHAALWDSIGAILDGAGERAALPPQYRRLCQCLALAEQRGYSPALVAWLQQRVAQCHRLLYGSAPERPATLAAWIRADLPRRVRAEWRLLLVALLALFGSAAVVALLIWLDPQRAYLFMPPEQLANFQQMYQPHALKNGRGDQGDVMMFGHYIWNNVSIGFRTFAGGVFGGVPALASLLFNGLHLGVAACWLSMDAATRVPFWSFVITHSSVEFAGLVLSALAGIRLGLALIRPGRMTRRHALQATAQYVFPLVAGAALLTVLAAFIEGFWSAHAGIAPAVKFAVGGAGWVALLLYFALAGRGRN